MKILDWYILKRYLISFVIMLIMFVPIGIIINLSEKIDNLKQRNAPLDEILYFYVNFVIHFANLLFPILLFLSVIWFTSKLANNSEIIAFLSSGVSFMRFLRPYFVGATIVFFIALSFSMYIYPNSSEDYNTFYYKYFSNDNSIRDTKNIYRQINDNEYIYASSYSPQNQTAYNFTLEHFEGERMTFKITTNQIKFNKDSLNYTLKPYIKRTITEREDYITKKASFDTILPFELDELTPTVYAAETKNYFELLDFIEEEKQRGSPYIKLYMIDLYRRWSVPVSTFILTIIAVAVSSIKKRGGMGINLAIGIVVAFSYVFLDKVFGVFAEKSSFPPVIAVWASNVIFAILAIILLQKAKR
ncbi:LptF/LptG family permease [Flavobacterium sp. CS20]|uniref:LptF/LptG family permease n=1 Tax=Flavobacterium sp. CS20 TaxID=2775246 RepID=UPI001B3A15DE|nr:LptF/LptG family permease [Flavobacterium sp. CS20]QTY27512.1 LptF/LptG family permease [Flavobacterium sp. CS20]